MKTIHLLCVLIALFGPAAFQDPAKSTCSMKRKCRDCITAGCQWCADPSIVKESSGRCFTAGTQHSKCRKDYVYPKSDPHPLEIEPNADFRTNVLFRPQKVTIKLNVGEKFPLNFRYKHAADYPVDLYYLMDLSQSMRKDKKRLSELGNTLASTMQRLTKEFSIGFGSFVDKVEMPYTSTLPDMLDHPCDGNLSCAPAYSFKNHLKLNNNTALFSTKVRDAEVSANIDTPEGGLDAIMQSIVCKNHIGWRDNARHLLIFTTDAPYHIAGDGRLAGLIEPNDMKCYLSDDGKYRNDLEFDYPSISQINQVAKNNHIDIIFAVTKHLEDYEKLAERVGATAGKLESGSNNVVDLIEKEYKKILGNVALITNPHNEHIKIQFRSQCNGVTWRDTNTCDKVKQGQEINFSATIEVTNCPDDGVGLQHKRKETFRIQPKAVDNFIEVNLVVSCDCPCENIGNEGYVPNSPDCSNNGNLLCGVCECNDGFDGEKCQCEKKKISGIGSSDTENENMCKNNDDTQICSGVGVCECGVCKCNPRSNPEEHHYGQYCECDDFTCERQHGLICSGPDHGTCDCGQCTCKNGWTGPACQCQDSKESCIEPGKDEECSGRGQCECGICKCNITTGNVRYSGQYCEECPSCPGQQCENYRNLVECKVFGSESLNKEDCSSDKFLDIVIVQVDRVEDPEEDMRDTIKVCKFPDDDGCLFFFRYMIGNRTLEVQKTKVCPTSVNVLALVLGLTGGIVLIGLLLLLIWKIITSIHDNREYSKFEKERAMSKWDAGDNPLYNPATSEFSNPTFGKED